MGISSFTQVKNPVDDGQGHAFAQQGPDMI
jgi:hypothetical protein